MLANYFRYDLRFESYLVPLEEEINHVQDYLEIEKARFEEKLSVRYEIDADVTIEIPTLILQPIVENAIVHGFGETTDHKARIFIKGYTQEGFLKFTIKDNGCGILPEKLEEIKKSRKDKNIHNGVGISNVYQRLRIYYGEKADIKIESSPDDGTRIEINIPLSEVKDNEE